MPEATLITAFALVASTLPLGWALRGWWLRRQALDKVMMLPHSDLTERRHRNWYLAPTQGIALLAWFRTLMRWLRAHPTVTLPAAAVALTLPFVAVSVTGDSPTHRDDAVAEAPAQEISEPIRQSAPDPRPHRNTTQ